MGVAAEKQNPPLYEGKPCTPALFLDLPEDGHRYELYDGVLHLSPSPIDEHSIPHGNFYLLIGNHLAATRRGRAFFEFSVFLPDGCVWEPDISVVLVEDYEIIQGHIHGVPALTVEVLSRSTRERDLRVKADSYLRCGVKEYWIVDPSDRSVQLWLNRNGAWEKTSGEKLASQVLSGLIIEAAPLFQ